MTRLLVVRHGATDWNAAGRIQGRTDIPLSATGRAEIARLAIPAEFQRARCFASPLVRARETAEILGYAPTAVGALLEMAWGRYEGLTLAELRARPGFAANEALGLDYRPEGGESPRDVQERLRPWLADVARDPAPAVAVAHRGVIRALYALATGWDMTGKAADKLDWARGHVFNLDPEGAPRVFRINLPLDDA